MVRSNCYIRPASKATLEALAGRYRKQDIDEVKAISGRTPEEAALYGLVYSRKVWGVYREEKALAIFGVGSVLPGIGVPWMLGTEDITENKIGILRLSKGVIKEMHKGYRILENFVDVRNTVSIEWLRWMGFRFEEPKPYGIEQRPFRRFYMAKGALNV